MGVGDMKPIRRRGNPQMKKGAPSINPAGRAAPTLRAAPGSDGVQTIGGYLLDGEKHTSLRGSSRWVTYDNLLAMLPGVAAAVRAWLLLASSVKWKAQENPRGGAQATAAALLIQEGMLDAHLPDPWRTSVVPRQLYGAAMLGFALHAKGTRRDSSGRIVFSELAFRPQWTVEKWTKPDETKAWDGIEQRSRMGRTVPIARNDLFYSGNLDLTSSPDGVGLFRHVVESERFRTRFRQLLGIAFDTDINGVPIGRAPLAKLALEAVQVGKIAATDSAAISAYVSARTTQLQDLLENRVVRPDRSLLLDSVTYLATTPDKGKTPSTVYEWDVDTFKTTIGSIPELRKEVADLDRECLRLFFAEWMMMGDGKGSTYGAHSDKTSMMGFAIDGWLDRIAVDAERDLVWWLVAKNGYDPETCAPSLEPEPVATQGALEAAQMLEALSKAALAADDEAADVVRERAKLPPRPKAKPGEKPTPAKKTPTKDEGDDVPDPGEGGE